MPKFYKDTKIYKVTAHFIIYRHIAHLHALADKFHQLIFINISL